MAKVLLFLLESLYVEEPQAQDLPVAREPSDIIDDNLSYNHINVAREIGIQYQLVGTALLDDTRGTIVPAILETCHHIIERVNTELL